MLPPPITTPTMEDFYNNNNQSIATKQQQKHQAPPHHQSALFVGNTSNTFPTSPITSSSKSPAASLAASSSTNNTFNTTNRIKTFFNKTFANVAKTNFSDYTAQYKSSSPASTSSSSSSSSILSTSQTTRTTLLGGGDVGSEVYDDILGHGNGGLREAAFGVVNNFTDGFGSYATAAAAADMAVSSLSNTTHHLEAAAATTTTAFPTAQTVATFIAGNKNRATTIIVYPTVSPESIVIPIVSCIFGFPILAFIVICCLRHRAKLARERDRRRNYDMQDHAVSLVRFSPIHRLNYRSSRAISLRPERSLSQGFTSLELDTVVEERCSDVEQTQTEILHPESPMESSMSSS